MKIGPKRGEPNKSKDTQKIRESVSKIILEIEKGGITAVRRYSEKFDGWNPPSFRVSEDEIQRAKQAIDPQLGREIDFAREQVEKLPYCKNKP